MLAEHGDRIVRDEDFAECYASRVGRPSIPPSLLAKVLLVQHRTGASDEQAMDCTASDLRWKVALGLPVDHQGWHPTSLTKYRARLLLDPMESGDVGDVGQRRAGWEDNAWFADEQLAAATEALLDAARRRRAEAVGRRGGGDPDTRISGRRAPHERGVCSIRRQSATQSFGLSPSGRELRPGGRVACRMDLDRARALLARERVRIEKALGALEREGPRGASDRREPGDGDSEDLYQDEFSAGRVEDLHRELAALERAEARFAAGTFGLSIESGEPIPDGRLEAVPTAERTVEEQQRYERQ